MLGQAYGALLVVRTGPKLENEITMCPLEGCVLEPITASGHVSGREILMRRIWPAPRAGYVVGVPDRDAECRVGPWRTFRDARGRALMGLIGDSSASASMDPRRPAAQGSGARGAKRWPGTFHRTRAWVRTS